MQFNNSELLEHRSTLLQALEELKYRRDECNNQQKRIETLVADNLQIQQDYEATVRKLKATEEKFEKLQDELVHLSSNASDSNLFDENKKLQDAVEAAEQTISSLKREISCLSLSRHQLEIALKQSEQKASAREKSCGVVKERLKLIEQWMEQLSNQLKQTTEAQNNLRKNADAAMDWNREIVRSSAHSNCILKDLRNERNNLRQKLFLLRSCLHCQEQPNKEGIEIQLLKDEILPLKAELKSVNELKKRNDTQIENLREQLLDSQNSLNKANILLKLSATQEESFIAIKMELKACETDKVHLQMKLNELQKNSEQEKKEGKIKIDEISARSKSMKERLESQIDILQLQLNNAEDKVGKELENWNESERIRSDLENRVSEMKQVILKQMDEISQLRAPKDDTENRMQEIQHRLDDCKSALTKPVCESKHIQTQDIAPAEKLSLYSDGDLQVTSPMCLEVSCSIDSCEAGKNETPLRPARIIDWEIQNCESAVATGSCEHNVTQPTDCSQDSKNRVDIHITGIKTSSELNTNILQTALPLMSSTADTTLVSASKLRTTSPLSKVLTPLPAQRKSAIGIINDQVNTSTVLERYYASQGSRSMPAEVTLSTMSETNASCIVTDIISDKEYGLDIVVDKSCVLDSDICMNIANSKAMIGREEGKSELICTGDRKKTGGTSSVSPILVSKPLSARFHPSSSLISLPAKQESDKRLDSFNMSECKKQNKRRKLSSTPPLYDASQTSLEGDLPLVRSKSAPLKAVSKQFVKQVTDTRKVSSRLDTRLKPLTFVTVAQCLPNMDSLTDSEAFDFDCLISKRKLNQNVPNDSKEGEYLSLRNRMPGNLGHDSFAIENENCKNLSTGFSGSFRTSDTDTKTYNSKPVKDVSIQEGITQVDESPDSSSEF